MGFFDVPPPLVENEDEDDFDDHFMEDPPGRWLGGVVAIEEIIGRSDRAAVAVRRIVAFEDGLELQLVAWVRTPTQRRGRGRHRRFHQGIQLSPHGPYDIRDEDGNLADELVRFGVLFPDGAKVTNLNDLWPLSPDATETMHGMNPRGGSGSEGEADQEFWIWPLPDAGDLTLVCQWPAYDIAESHLVIDGDRLREAAARATPVWPDQAARHSHGSPQGRMLPTIGTTIGNISSGLVSDQ